MNDFPPIGHVALTVTNLGVSRPWYQHLIGARPVLDEPTDGGFHHTVSGLGFRDPDGIALEFFAPPQ